MPPISFRVDKPHCARSLSFSRGSSRGQSPPRIESNAALSLALQGVRGAKPFRAFFFRLPAAERISPVIPSQPPILLSLRASDRCHWRGNPCPPSPRRRRGHPVIPSQSADWRGNPFPKFFIIHQTPAIRRGSFTCCLRRGTFVTSDKSTQKRRLKLRFKPSSARYALPQTCFMFLA